ncbi:hypothetical protein BH721_05670 [Clostridium baratii]|uniref:hypothetical protein n=1 Tax=Clostridium baratii TaxID=1561 RepID=UPI0009A2E8B4|nr:hypothetical protein [Clostridium baratii]OPF52748.1 hypothetical protein A1M12_11880 [Clostridium baratii]OPF56198.1 hypothetical protein BH721_05670 [Clostridium baratii]OPF58207.1 hypothetical protein BH724_04905 [Clostridium baratii]OPF59420.1 hypothetical protein BH725_02250 [Clostridium baratii]
MNKLDIAIAMNMINLKCLIMVVFVCGLFTFIKGILKSLNLHAKAILINKCSNFIFIFGCTSISIMLLISFIMVFK